VEVGGDPHATAPGDGWLIARPSLLRFCSLDTMDATARAVRIYWAETAYGDIREAPTPGPSVSPDFPRTADSLGVWFGPVPEGIRHEVRTHVAMQHSALVRMSRPPSMPSDEETDQQFAVDVSADDELTFTRRAWYVTMVLDRPVVLDDARLRDDSKYWWIDPEAVESAIQALRADALNAFDLAVSAIAPLAPLELFAGRVFTWEYVVAGDRGPVSCPRVRMTGHGFGHRSVGDFPFTALSERLAELGRRSHEWEFLAHASYWYQQMRGESDDQLKRFLWGFVALEVLTNALYKRVSKPAEDGLMQGAGRTDSPETVVLATLINGRKPLAARFAVVAVYLSPSTAAGDVTSFTQAYKARNDIAHGKELLTDQRFPLRPVEMLLQRYLNLAFGLA